MTENLLATHLCVPKHSRSWGTAQACNPSTWEGHTGRSVSGNRDLSCPLYALPDSKTLYRERLQALLLPHHILPWTIVLPSTLEMSFVTFGDFCNIHLSEKYQKSKQNNKKHTVPELVPIS